MRGGKEGSTRCFFCGVDWESVVDVQTDVLKAAASVNLRGGRFAPYPARYCLSASLFWEGCHTYISTLCQFQ